MCTLVSVRVGALPDYKLQLLSYLYINNKASIDFRRPVMTCHLSVQVICMYMLSFGQNTGNWISLCIIVRARDNLTLFFLHLQCFFMFVIDVVFVLNSNPSASLKSIGIFVGLRSKVNFKVKYDFSRNEARNKCNTSFSCDSRNPFLKLFWLIMIIFKVQGQFQGQVRGNI